MMYEVLPLKATEGRANIISYILRKIFAKETVFGDYQRGCGKCEDKSLEEMCGGCRAQMALIARSLTHSGARAWEIWSVEKESKVVGIVYFSNIIYGNDATGHYIFFDEKLSDKTEVLNEIMDWAFEDHLAENWKALERLTIEIPEQFAALIRHAHKKLGFGGPFTHVLSRGMYKGREKTSIVKVEGRKERAVLWRGERKDLLILGRLNPKESQLLQT